jgi:hypothetical protein
MPAVQITTRYHGPVGLTGSRITATVTAVTGTAGRRLGDVPNEHAGRRVTVPYDYAARDPHLIAAEALADKLGLAVPVYVGTHNAGNIYRSESEV